MLVQKFHNGFNIVGPSLPCWERIVALPFRARDQGRSEWTDTDI
jgi:hypothetical protein